jgi:hypothetical protein
MDKSILIPLVSGCFAILCALVALFQSWRLEKIKIDENRRKAALEITRQKSIPIENALTKAWENIQILKHVISKIIAPIRYDADIALETIKEAHKHIEEEYAKSGIKIPDSARDSWHKAKEISAQIIIIVAENSRANDKIDTFSEEEIKTLSNYRSELTDLQSLIVESRSKLQQNILDLIIKEL